MVGLIGGGFGDGFGFGGVSALFVLQTLKTTRNQQFGLTVARHELLKKCSRAKARRSYGCRQILGVAHDLNVARNPATLCEKARAPGLQYHGVLEFGREFIQCGGI